MKPKIREVIVVEGRYDANTLHQVVDAAIVTTEGFGVFKNKEKQTYFRRLAKERGLIIFTDPDGAGFVIRNFLKGAIPTDQLKQAYIPDVYGKEKRKKVGGKEGKLGVEGMTPEVILEALRRCGATFEGEEFSSPVDKMTKADLLEFGLIGPNSSIRRAALQKDFGLPERLTPNALLEALNLLASREQVEKWCASR